MGYKCRKQFCTFDDYNWDWSIQSLIGSCIPQLETLVVLAPRVIHVGDCNGGFHVKNSKHCDIQGLKRKIQPFVDEATTTQQSIDSEYFTHGHKLKKLRTTHFKANGGWADPRDHALFESYNILVVKTEAKKRKSRGKKKLV